MALLRTSEDLMAWVERNIDEACARSGYALSSEGVEALRGIWQPACDAFRASSQFEDEFQQFAAEMRFKIGLIGESFALAARLNRSMSVGADEVRSGMEFFWSTRAPTPRCPPAQPRAATLPPT